MNTSLWEMGLFAVLIVLAVQLFLNFHRYNLGVRLSSLVVGIIVGIFHFVFDSFNFFMIPLYTLYGILLVLNVGRLIRARSLPSKVKRRSVRILLACLCTLLVIVVIIVPGYVVPHVELAKPTGTHAVGVLNYHWIDSSREEVNTPEEDNRQLKSRVWYPAETTLNAIKAPYASEIENVLSASLSLENELLANVVHQVEGHAYDAVPVAKDLQQYPVLILSHGYGMSGFSNTTFAEELASHGFIVVGVEHPHYNMLPSVLSEGGLASGMVELGMADNWDLMKIAIDEVLLKDIQFIIDELNTIQTEDPHGRLSGKLNLNKIGMLGHSMGGALTAQVMRLEPRIKAGVNMDGFPYGELIEGLQQPFMYMITGDTEYFMSSTMPESIWSDPAEYGISSQMRYEAIAQQVSEGILATVRNGGYKVVFPEADHLDFTDMPLYSPLLENRVIDNNKLHQSINELLLAFFTENLVGEEGALLHMDNLESDLYHIERF
ncbi:alpha/beta hydrolase family protein [Paenibacillus sp. Z3-2]